MLPQFFWRECRLSDLWDDLRAAGHASLSGLHGGARALALAAWQVGTGRTLFVLCRTDEVAAALARDLAFFLGEVVALLPERENDLEARSARIVALHRVLTRQAALLVASVAAPLPRTISPAALQGAVVSLYPQRIAPRDTLLSG